MKQIGIFDESIRLEKISKLGDNLVALKKTIDWEKFRPIIDRAIPIKNDSKKGGRPSFDHVMMFKILILQRLYNLSDDQMEFQINDRISFMRFLDLSISDTIPDAKTIWKFREDLKNANVIRKLFQKFNYELKKRGFIANEGSIIDATFVEVPRQRNTHEENEKIKNGEVPEEWQKPENAAKLAQKDTDARWTKKNNETFYGYKDSVLADAKSKLICDYSVTNAAVHDSLACRTLITSEIKSLYADSAYSGKEIAEILESLGIENHIHEKGYRNKPLTDEQKESNKNKSKIRARIEHIFGFMTGAMHGITSRCIGMKRNEFNIGLTNLTYNMCRLVQLSANC